MFLTDLPREGAHTPPTTSALKRRERYARDAAPPRVHHRTFSLDTRNQGRTRITLHTDVRLPNMAFLAEARNLRVRHT